MLWVARYFARVKAPGGELIIECRPELVPLIAGMQIAFGKNHRRAQRLLSFFQACALPGVQLYSLQKGPPSAELTSLPRGGPIIDLDPHIHDFADTAVVIAQLDLVIMTDSSVAHLAGAMGKPVWVLLGHNAHWLWLLDRIDNPWYLSMRLFRPRAEGDWDYVFDAISAELMRLATSQAVYHRSVV